MDRRQVATPRVSLKVRELTVLRHVIGQLSPFSLFLLMVKSVNLIIPNSRQILDKTIAELSNIGVANINSFTNPDSLNLQLTSNSISFTQAYLQLTDHLLQLLTPGTRHLVNESLVSVLHAHLRHMEQSVKTDKADRQLDNQFVAKNAAFILDTVITLVEHKYQV